MLILASMSSFFKAFSESHLFCSIWCNKRLVLTYVYAILSNSKLFYQTAPTPPFSNGCHFSMDGARMLTLDSISSSFQARWESHLFCWIWCNRRPVLTYTCNPVQLCILSANTPYPSIFKWSPFPNRSLQAFSESQLFCSIRCNRRLVLSYIFNPFQFRIFLPNTFSMDWARMLRLDSISSSSGFFRILAILLN